MATTSENSKKEETLLEGGFEVMWTDNFDPYIIKSGRLTQSEQDKISAYLAGHFPSRPVDDR